MSAERAVRTQLVSSAWVLTLDLDEELPDVPTSPHPLALVLVRNQGLPLAEVVVPVTHGMGPAQLREAVLAELRERGIPTPAHGSPRRTVGAPALSIVVTTCGNPGPLTRCIDSILRLRGVTPEVIVVDNRPSDPRTRLTVEERYASDSRVRLVQEPRRGLSRARNAGVAAAANDLVAWTDDDCVADPWWGRSIVEGLRSEPDVRLVCGLVRPLELDTPAQVWREVHRGYFNGLQRRVFRLGAVPPDMPLFPFTPGRIGTGANMGAYRDHLLRMGGFDEALGAGTPAAGGEDLDLIVRFWDSGAAVLYEPAAMVSHAHHGDFDALVDQARSYGTGMASFLITLMSDRRHRRQLVRRVPAGWRHWRALRATGSGPVGAYPGFTIRLRRAETLGIIEGGVQGLRTRVLRRRSAADAGSGSAPSD